jgi:hypothetical protein
MLIERRTSALNEAKSAQLKSLFIRYSIGNILFYV